MKKKILGLAVAALIVWDLFYIFVIANSFVVESLKDTFTYWGYPQWGGLYSSPSFFKWFNIIYLLLLVAEMVLAWMWRSNFKKMLLPLILVALLSLLNMYYPNYVRSHEFAKYMTADGVDKSAIPAGSWVVSDQLMDSYADQTLMNKVMGWFGRGEWPGNTAMWGEYRVWLSPGDNTSMEGRRGLVLHGGNKLGSPWGINIGKNMTDLANDLKVNHLKIINIEY